jgi:hypothetical protein
MENDAKPTYISHGTDRSEEISINLQEMKNKGS